MNLEKLLNAIAQEKRLMDEFSSDLRAFRKERGWSQATLAEKLGVSQQMIAALESGRRKPTINLLRDLDDLARRPPVADKLEELILSGLPAQDIQLELARLVRETTGKPARGQLWQPCLVEGCQAEPVCLNCLKCEAHCECGEFNR